jgi:hypothetical protein
VKEPSKFKLLPSRFLVLINVVKLFSQLSSLFDSVSYWSHMGHIVKINVNGLWHHAKLKAVQMLVLFSTIIKVIMAGLAFRSLLLIIHAKHTLPMVALFWRGSWLHRGGSSQRWSSAKSCQPLFMSISLAWEW